MLHATFATPDLTVFCRLDELGLVAVGQRLEPDRAVIECRVAEPNPWCRGCASQGLSRGRDTRRLAHEPFGHRPTTLLIRVRRYTCSGCGRSWREDLTAAAPARAKLSRRGMRWALEALVIDHLTVSRVAWGLGVSWGDAPSTASNGLSTNTHCPRSEGASSLFPHPKPTLTTVDQG